MLLGSSWQCKSVHRALPDHGCRRYRSFLPFRRNSLLEALSRLRRGPAFPFPASLWLKWPFTWRSNVVCNRRHQSAHIATHSLLHTFTYNHPKFPTVNTHHLARQSNMNILNIWASDEGYIDIRPYRVICKDSLFTAVKCGDLWVGTYRYTTMTGSPVLSHNRAASNSTGHHKVLSNFSRQCDDDDVTRRNYSVASDFWIGYQLL